MEDLHTNELVATEAAEADVSRFSAAMDLMSVLAPATPPEPRNARVISRIGLGASKDAQPVKAAPGAQRKVDRQLRRSTLLSAAGFK